MSPHEMDAYRVRFDAAASRLGWVRRTVETPHERESNRSSREEVWYSANGQHLFGEDDLSPGLAEEIIRIAGGR